MSEETATRDAYQVLHVRRDAPQVVVRAAFHALAGTYHPDVNSSADAESRMAELNRAYAQVRTADLRAAYEQLGDTPPPAKKAWAMGGAVAPPAGRAFSQGSMVIDFGRYEGWTIADLSLHDPDFLRWLGRHVSGQRYRREIDERLRAAERSARPAPKPQPARRGWSRLGI